MIHQSLARMLKWIEEKEIDFQTLIKILRTCESTDFKSALVAHWFLHKKPESTYPLIVELFRLGIFGSIYEYSDVVQIVKNLHMDEMHIPVFCKDLFPNNEASQLALFKAFKGAADYRHLNWAPLLRTFASSLIDDDLSMEALRIRVFPAIRMTDLVTIIDKKIPSQFYSLKKVFDLPLSETLKSEALEENTLPTLGVLFTVFFVMGRVDDWVKMLKPETLVLIREAYHLGSQKVCLSEREISVLKKIGIPALPSTALICHYLRVRMPKIPPLSESKNKLVSQGIAQQNFLALLNKRNVNGGDVGDFFKTILGIEDDIKAENLSLLFHYYMRNREKIAYILSQEAGLETLTQLISTLGDGCIANIGTQINIAVNLFLFNDPLDAVLYDCFIKNIAIPTLNSMGDRLGDSPEGIELFSQEDILESYLSPEGLMNKLSQQFYMNSQLIRNPWAFIGQVFGSDMQYKLYEDCERRFSTNKNENLPLLVNVEGANLASYLVIQKALPSLLTSPHFQKMVEKYQSRLAHIKSSIDKP
jgi:hypothetical protein